MGAWIETHKRFGYNEPIEVAPRVGAWIETRANISIRRMLGSHPVWVRGLKHLSYTLPIPLGLVAPRVGAWIETTFSITVCDIKAGSHPVWVRGLKQLGFFYYVDAAKSHPVWVRGLKQT